MSTFACYLRSRSTRKDKSPTLRNWISKPCFEAGAMEERHRRCSFNAIMITMDGSRFQATSRRLDFRKAVERLGLDGSTFWNVV